MAKNKPVVFTGFYQFETRRFEADTWYNGSNRSVMIETSNINLDRDSLSLGEIGLLATFEKGDRIAFVVHSDTKLWGQLSSGVSVPVFSGNIDRETLNDIGTEISIELPDGLTCLKPSKGKRLVSADGDSDVLRTVRRPRSDVPAADPFPPDTSLSDAVAGTGAKGVSTPGSTLADIASDARKKARKSSGPDELTRLATSSKLEREELRGAVDPKRDLSDVLPKTAPSRPPSATPETAADTEVAGAARSPPKEPAWASSAVKGTAFDICTYESETGLTNRRVSAKLTRNDFHAAAIADGRSVKVTGYRYDETLEALFPLDDGKYKFAAADGSVVPLSIPFFGRMESLNDNARLQPVRPLGGQAPGPADEKEINPLPVLVIGDAASVAQAGLDSMQRNNADSLALAPMSISWVQVQESGELSDPVSADDFVALTEVARKDAKEAFFIQSDARFDTLMNNFESLLTTLDGPVSMVIWVKEGQLMPTATVARFEAFLKRISKVGMVERRSDGTARQWLRVVTGRYAQSFSQQYLQGPIETSSPLAGKMMVETPPTSPDGERSLLTVNNARSISDALSRSMVRRGARPASAVASVSQAVFDPADLFDRVGVLVPGGRIADLAEALDAVTQDGAASDVSVPVDPYGLLLPKTDGTSRITSDNSNPRLTRVRRIKVAREFGEVALGSALNTIAITMQRAQEASEIGDCEFLFVDSPLQSR